MAHTGFNSRKGSRVFLDGQLYYALPVQFFSLGDLPPLNRSS